MGEVGLDRLGMDSAGERGDPGHDCCLRGREDGAIRIVEAVEANMVDEGALTSGVCFSGVCGETMPKVKGDGFGVLWELSVPPIWRIFEDGFWFR
jgi:hypothetical protein